MPRPRKWWKVCGMPENTSFGPLDSKSRQNCRIEMTVDEYETIRLIDYEGLNQEECAARMHVARTTVQGIYVEARRKLAQSLVEGRWLWIEGGDFKLCDGHGGSCGGGGCRRRAGCRHQVSSSNTTNDKLDKEQDHENSPSC